uniref:C2H2-type domain-containing protein n=1 Tax=Petromyzon marinus TaxID=7757 RepID=S4RET6_PETMA
NLKATQPEVAAEKRHRCELCGKTYSLAFNLKRHTYVHTGAWPCRCKVCGHGVLRASSNGLRLHQRKHAGDKNFFMVLCSEKSKRSNYIRNRRRSHESTGEKPYRCEVCGQTYSQLSHKVIYYIVIAGNKTHRCELCGKSYSKPYGLKQHMRIHTGEKLHRCEVCRHPFLQLSSLKIHLRTHTNTSLHPFLYGI